MPNLEAAATLATPLLLLVLLLALTLVSRKIIASLRPNDDLQRVRLVAEQILAGQRHESETNRALLANAERVLTAGQAQMRQAVEQRLGELTTSIARDQGESRVLLESKLREMADQNALRLGEIQRSVNEQLHQAVEKQMQSSFQRVIDQFTAVQKAMTDIHAVTNQIGDLKRIFSNVKGRGGWGETQLRALLDDLIPGGYETNARLREGSAEVVEFAVRMPVRGEARPLLAIDAKFPTSDYERLLEAAEQNDPEGERAARRGLETRLRQEGRKIASKYIVPPNTVEFAILYLPTDGLYAEAARIPGLIDDLGRTSHVLVMGPSLLPALLRTVQLGYVTLALEQKTQIIGQLLSDTKREMLKMDDVLERLWKNAGTMTKTIEDARQRTRVMARKLKTMESNDTATSLLDGDGDDREP